MSGDSTAVSDRPEEAGVENLGRLIIFTRYPQPGKTKTRLIPALGPDGAADLQRQMTEHTVKALSTLSHQGVSLQIRYEGGSGEDMEGWLGKELSLEHQGEGDLGLRMERALRLAFEEGFKRAVVVGTDCPSLGADDVVEAFDLLENNSLVLGPATDGGYYLIAMRSDTPKWIHELVFHGIPWGTDQVFNATMNALAETGIDVGLLDERADVDDAEDLVHWYQETNGQTPEPASVVETGHLISVIIPTLNEEEGVGGLIDSLKHSGVEIVVADGGSTDGTVAICNEQGVPVIPSQRGRAAQMNAGAMAARGDVFLFLHADSRLPEGFADSVRGALAEGSVAGAFLFGTDLDTVTMNIIENAAHFRSFRLGIVFGDQAIFTTREAFFRAGTYPDQPLMEDYELWKRLGKVGRRSLVPRVVVSSARKWQRYGTWKLMLMHQAVMWLYILGVKPDRLARWYEKTGAGGKGRIMRG